MDKNIFIYESPLGNIGCIFDRNGYLIKIERCPDEYEPKGTHSFFEELDAYFKGNLKVFKTEFRISEGTKLEIDVWNTLKDIPFGETRTYKWISERIGRPDALRAVGQALKRNPLPIILPCHRVISSNNSIGGYSWGLEIKRFLLSHEKRFMAD